jgi:rhodanese-related sulfurtransferase
MPATEAGERSQRGELVIVDVRDADSFRQEHIAGAVNIPLDEVSARGEELPRDKRVVTYCA